MLRYPPLKILDSAKLALLFRADHVIVGAEGLLNSKDFPLVLRADDHQTREADLLANGLAVPALRQGRSFEELYEIQQEIQTSNRCQDRTWARFLDKAVAEILPYSENEFRTSFKSYAEEQMGGSGYHVTIKGLALQEIAEDVRARVLSQYDTEGKLRRTHFIRVAENYPVRYRNSIYILATIPYHQALIDALGVGFAYPSEWRALVDYGFVRYHYAEQSLESELQKLLQQIFVDKEIMNVVTSMSGLNLDLMKESVRRLSARDIKSIQQWSEYEAFIKSTRKDEAHRDSKEFFEIADNYFHRLGDYSGAAWAGTIATEKRINVLVRAVQWGTLSLSVGRTILSVLFGLDPISIVGLFGSLLSLTLRREVPKALRRRRLKRAIAATELNAP